jgi:tetratricopeptide (TPR) repeat protein
MKLTNLTVKELFINSTNLTFLIGAGCSVDAPSCLPAGRSMMEAIINYTCAVSERDKLLKIKDLRFEQLVEIVRDTLDSDLKIIDYYGQCDKPNLQHFFLADMIKKGQFVMTTNFDFLIEYAILQLKIPKNEIISIITKQDFERYSDPNKLLNEGKKGLYKIHGSTKNVITSLNTKEYLITTIQAFGLGKEGESVFQIEPFKRPLFENISNNRTLVIMGYSGSDDFDIVPTLMVLKNLKNIIWINYIQDDGGTEKVYELDDSVFQKTEKPDKVNQILIKLYRMHNAEKVYRVNVNTTRLLEKLIDFKLSLSNNTFSISPLTWFKNNITPPDEFKEYYIPFKIYDASTLNDEAMNCSKTILEIAEKKGDKKWKSLALNNMGLLLKGKGELAKALKYYREALIIDEQLGDLRSKATGLGNIGVILEGRGNLDEALKYYRESLAIAEQLGDLRGKATKLSNIGLLLYSKGELNDALKHYQEALVIDEQLGNLSGRATVLNNIGLLLDGKGELDKALKSYQEALAIVEQLGDLQNKAIGLSNIGVILESKGDWGEALNYYRESLTIAEQLGDLRGKATRLNNIGLLLYDKGELDEALNYFLEALGIFKELSSPNVEIVKKNIEILKEKMK